MAVSTPAGLLHDAGSTYMVSLAPSYLRQLLGIAQLRIKHVTLLLRARVLPIRTMRMRKRPIPLIFLRARL